ncbi:hypothetical protein Tco_0527184 [Tanacetum coccineum]
MAVVKKMASGFGFHTVRMKASGFVGIKKYGWGIVKNGWGIEKNGRGIANNGRMTVWSRMKVLAGLSTASSSISDVVDQIVPISKRRQVRCIIAKLVIAACAYFVWQENGGPGKHYNLEIDPLRSDQRMWGGHTLIIRDQTRRTGVTILLGSYNLVLVVHPTVQAEYLLGFPYLSAQDAADIVGIRLGGRDRESCAAGPLSATESISMNGPDGSILYVIMSPQSRRRGRGQDHGHGMGRDTIQLETAVSTISQEYLLEFTSEYGISEDLHPELPAPGDKIMDFLEDKIGARPSKRLRKNTLQCYTKPLDSLKKWNNRFFWVDEKVFPTVVDWRKSAPKDEKPAEGSYSVEDVARLDTRRTPFQK